MLTVTEIDSLQQILDYLRTNRSKKDRAIKKLESFLASAEERLTEYTTEIFGQGELFTITLITESTGEKRKLQVVGIVMDCFGIWRDSTGYNITLLGCGACLPFRFNTKESAVATVKFILKDERVDWSKPFSEIENQPDFSDVKEAIIRFVNTFSTSSDLLPINYATRPSGIRKIKLPSKIQYLNAMGDRGYVQ
jgi:hypothetical protein